MAASISTYQPTVRFLKLSHVQEVLNQKQDKEHPQVVQHCSYYSIAEDVVGVLQKALLVDLERRVDHNEGQKEGEDSLLKLLLKEEALACCQVVAY